MDRRPAIPVAVEGDEAIYTEYDWGRIKAGYCCFDCGEAHEEALPKACAACGFPMREEQAKRIALEFEGFTRIGPARSLEELRAEDEEAKARARYRREKPTSSIWLPS